MHPEIANALLRCSATIVKEAKQLAPDLCRVTLSLMTYSDEHLDIFISPEPDGEAWVIHDDALTWLEYEDAGLAQRDRVEPEYLAQLFAPVHVIIHPQLYRLQRFVSSLHDLEHDLLCLAQACWRLETYIKTIHMARALPC